PPAYQNEIFLPPSRRRIQEKNHLGEHRYLFYQTLTNFSEHLYISSPKTDEQKELVPSPFLDALAGSIGTEVLGPADLRLRFGGMYSESDLLERIGEQLSSDGVPSVEAGFLPAEMAAHIRHAMEVERSRTTPGLLPHYNGFIAGNLDGDAARTLESFRTRIYS